MPNSLMPNSYCQSTKLAPVSYWSLVFRHLKFFLPIVLVRPAKNQLGLFGPVVARLEQRADRRVNLHQPRLIGLVQALSFETIERGRDLQQLGADRKKLLLNYRYSLHWETPPGCGSRESPP